MSNTSNSASVALLHRPQGRIEHSLRVPGSKSYTNRALLMAALAPGVSTLEGASLSEDSEALILALKKLGIECQAAENLLKVSSSSGIREYRGEINVGHAGSTMRFLTSLCASIPNSDIVLSGSARMHERPIGPLVNALRELGASIEYLGKEGCPPLRIHSTSGLKGGSTRMPGHISSQFFSSLLLSSPRFREGLALEVQGQQISPSYIDMTIAGMADFGVTVANNDYQSYTLAPGQKYVPRHYKIEGDASGASYLWGLAALSAGTVRVCNINPHSLQGDVAFPSLLERMGCSVISNQGESWIEVSGVSNLKAIDADMSSMPDTAQTLAVIATCACGSTKISGLSTLRVKETDRIAALENELSKLGIKSESGPDFIVVHGGPLKAAQIATYQDHRMAMSFAMLATRVDDLKIEDPKVVQKSFPDFWDQLNLLGIKSTEQDG